jgi:hypothetical protein
MTSGQRFLAAAADLFDETGEWPQVDDVQDLLVYRRDSTDAEREARRLSPAKGRCDEGSVCASVQGIFGADPAHPTLEYFERVLVLAAKKYKRRKRRGRTTLSQDEVAEVLSLTAEEADRALALLVSESLASVDPEGDEAVVIAPSIRHYFAVRSVSEYVRAKAKLDCRLCRAKRATTKARKLGGKIGRVAAGIVLSALAIVLATFLIWLATQALGDDHEGRAIDHPNVRSTPSDPPPPAPAGTR